MVVPEVTSLDSTTVPQDCGTTREERKMAKFWMFLFAMLVPAIAVAQQLAGGEARALVCGPGEIQVCTETQADGSPPKVLYLRGSPVIDCVVRSETGIRLDCVAWDEACVSGPCDRRGGNWEWNERSCHCDYERPRDSTPPTTTPQTPSTPPTTTPPGPTTPPVQPGPTPTCPDCGQCTAEDLQRILGGLNVIREEIDEGQLAVLTDEEVRVLRAEAENLREQANECRDEATADHAATLIALLEPDYDDEFRAVHNHLDNLDFAVEEEGHFCNRSFWGVLTCYVLPTAAIITGAVLGAYYGTQWSAYQD